MSDMPQNRHVRFLLILFYIILAVLFLYVFFKYLLWILMPFLIALLVAKIIEPSVSYLSGKFHIPRKAASAVMAILSVSLLTGVLYFAISSLFREISEIAENYPNMISVLSKNLFSISGKLNGILSKLTGREMQFAATDILQSISAPDFSSIIDGVKNVAFSIPTALVSVITSIISAYLISCDYQGIRSRILRQFEAHTRLAILRTKAHLFSALSRWMLSQFILTVITFVLLLFGFLVLNIKYALTLSIVIAFLDALPLIGSGTILIPWSIISFIIGNSRTAIGLIVIYLVITVSRNIIEPKIVGDYIGLSPLLTVVAIYMGFRLFGITGMFVFPFLFLTVSQLHKWEYIKIWKE